MKGYHDSETPESIRDLWQTPKEVFDYYNKRFNLNLDMAASEDNSLSDWWISEDEDSLLHATMDGKFTEASEYCLPIRGVWCNPPYSKIMPWVAMVTEYADKFNVPFVMLIPSDTSVKWFKLAFDNCTECHFISGRLSFVNAETKKPVSGNNKGSVAFVFDPKSPVKRQVVLIDRDKDIYSK